MVQLRASMSMLVSLLCYHNLEEIAFRLQSSVGDLKFSSVNLKLVPNDKKNKQNSEEPPVSTSLLRTLKISNLTSLSLRRAAHRSSPRLTSWSQQGWSVQSRCELVTSPSHSRARRTTSACSTSRGKFSASPPSASTPPVSSVRTPR